MLLSFSPEGTLVLTLFELVLSGLALVVLLWIRVREPANGSPLARRALLLGFALLTAGFAGRAAYCHLAIGPPPSGDAEHFWLLFAAEAMRLLGAGSLVIGYLVMHGRRRRAALVAALMLGLLAVATARVSPDALLSIHSIVPLTTARVSEAGLLLVGVTLIGRASGILPAAALLLLAAGRASAALSTWRPATAVTAWALEHVFTLVALIALALVIERQSRQLALRFFLRLNLTFVVLASSLILAVTEIERGQLLELAAGQAEELAEFVRGHMLYYAGRGEPPEKVLTHDDVTRKLVAEFGRYPDLRRVQVSLHGRTMALAINEDGEITQQLWVGERIVPPPVSPADFSVAPLLQMPIVSAGRPIGRVELNHSLVRINERIGWQMQLVFAIFTLFVGGASVVTGMLVVTADRTIRRQFEEIERTQRRLSLAERLATIGAMADGVAHEINNPAGILVARTDYLLSVVRESAVYAEIRDDLETIRRQTHRIARTVKDLLTFTRPTRLCREVLDVHTVLDSAILLNQSLVGERGVRVERRFASAPLLVCGDRHRLEQVFTNLLANAAQAIQGDGQIIVTTAAQPTDGGVEIVVRDTGSGIPPEHLDRIFDPFFTTKEPGSGTGLGLSIAYGIVRDHNGAIDVTSTRGVGTEVRIILPPASACARATLDDGTPAVVLGRKGRVAESATGETSRTDD